jgi:CRISPR-associated protein Csx16
MTTWFISRHPGAIAWAARQGLLVDQQVSHLEPGQVQPGDTVIGTLPVNLAAEVCRVGAHYINLSVNVPADLRGTELSLEQMIACQARLEAFEIISKPLLIPQAHEAESLDLIASLPLMQVSVKARSLGMQMPHNIGSAWHGGLGKVLHDTQPETYAALYGNEGKEGDAGDVGADGAERDDHPGGAQSRATRPYVLRPPQPDADISAGAHFGFSIILIGTGVKYAAGLCAAIQQLGAQGVGPGRGQFVPENIECKMIQLAELSPQASDITLHFLSPTLIKENNRHIKNAPSMQLLIKRIISRAELYLQHLTVPVQLPDTLKQALLQQADQILPVKHEIEWHSTPRYSARQKAWMPFGGMSGSLQFERLPVSLLIWLELAQWLHIGNKTTFGHGRIAIAPISQESIQ